jgi:hypothetical protein
LTLSNVDLAFSSDASGGQGRESRLKKVSGVKIAELEVEWIVKVKQ